MPLVECGGVRLMDTRATSAKSSPRLGHPFLVQEKKLFFLDAVRDGNLFCARGFGYGDLGKKTPVHRAAGDRRNRGQRVRAS